MGAASERLHPLYTGEHISNHDRDFFWTGSAGYNTERRRAFGRGRNVATCPGGIFRQRDGSHGEAHRTNVSSCQRSAEIKMAASGTVRDVGVRRFRGQLRTSKF